MTDLIKPDEFTLPPDLINIGVKCHDCLSERVIYQISVPALDFPCGAYCYKCLLNHCRQTHRIPLPMELELLNRLQADLGIFHARKIIVPGFS